MKSHRGSSPRQELHDGFMDRIDGHKPIDRSHQYSLEVPEEVYVPEEQPGEAERWQDDGGESGLQE